MEAKGHEYVGSWLGTMAGVRMHGRGVGRWGRGSMLVRGRMVGDWESW
jgi:hypothetical protein